VSVGGTGLLDQRVTLYAYAVTVDDTGVPVERYPEWGTRWGRIEPPTGRERTLGEREAHQIDAVLVLRTEIPVLARWLAEVGGVVYRVLAILPRRMQGLQHLLVTTADDAAETVVES